MQPIFSGSHSSNSLLGRCLLRLQGRMFVCQTTHLCSYLARGKRDDWSEEDLVGGCYESFNPLQKYYTQLGLWFPIYGNINQYVVHLHMGDTAIHTIQYSLNSCLLLLPCRSEGTPCVDWLRADVKTTVESVFVVHPVLSALLQVEHPDPIQFHPFFLTWEKKLSNETSGVIAPVLPKATSCRYPRCVT